MLQLLGRGLQRKEIAHELQISENTVKSFIARATEKLSARTTIQAVVFHELSAHRRCHQKGDALVAERMTRTGGLRPT